MVHSSPGLHALLHPRSTSDFLSEGLPTEPCVTEPGAEIAALRKLPFLRSRRALLHRWAHSVQAHLPDVADESSSIDVSPTDAEKCFGNGMGLLFNNVERLSPTLRNALRRIRRELGLPRATYGRCIVYATPDGKGTRTHFDQNINFVVQIHGTKRWWLAPNRSVANPTERFTLGQPRYPELASYWPDPAPDAMAADAEGVVLRPGSVLYVPRGYWHRTEADGEALALNFTFSQPTWIDLFTAALRSRLLQSPEWRALADGAGSRNAERRVRAESQLDELLAELVYDLPHWRAADILGATEGDRRGRRSPTDLD